MSMKDLYEAASISRQAFHQWMKPSELQIARTPEPEALEMAEDVRKKILPGSCARELYFYIRKKHPQYNSRLFGWGKHTFEALCLRNGLRVEYRRFVPKTTVRGDFVFQNLVEGMEMSNINQVWVSDICYLFGTNGTLLGYATSIIDLYSRKLLGLSFSQTMHAAVTSQEALRQAYGQRKNYSLENLIFHSDAGKQYIEKGFLASLKNKKIRSSMAESCYQNAFAEAFNDILKNHLLHDLNLNSFAQLKKSEQFIKHCYNNNRPHNSINRLTPNEFEQNISTLQNCQRTRWNIKVVSQS
jgi:putative transposase